MAAAASPSTPAVLFTALAGVAIVAVIFYGASRRRHKNPSSNSSPPSSPSPSSSPSTTSSWTYLRSVLFIVSASSSHSRSLSDRGRITSPWSHRKRKHVLSPQQWRSLFAEDGRLCDDGVKFLKRVRSGGVDPSIRAEVFPFLLGVYDLDSTKEERDVIRTQNRKQYEKLRRECRKLLKKTNERSKLDEDGEISYEGDGENLSRVSGSSSDDAASARQSLSSEDRTPVVEHSDDPYISTPSKAKSPTKLPTTEDFSTWQRIIRLDAVRANAEWMTSYPSLAEVSDSRAHRTAEAVGLKDYGHLEPGRIFHAARLVAILEAYALYDSDIGYCQGMSDLLSPIISVISEDYEAFWCFVGFMKKARQNFRLDEVGIRRQLDLVAKIIKFKDAHLFRHLEKLQAEDCFFVYRMVVVMFRRELTFEQTLCLWEVVWADQAAIRAGIGKSAWSRIRQRAPPTDDLLLYAIAASVLQRRKLIIEKYSSMDEIIKECNSMSGQLDVWKLLDDAHNLVVTLHDKIETPFS
uniref:GTPase-activating protein gyp7 n=1 Tax=Cajanus cajan TaxID=3821 RepID=A0A151UH10_CAJCA